MVERRSPSIYSVGLVMLPSQLLRDFSLTILTNFLSLWNKTALPYQRGEIDSKSPLKKGDLGVAASLVERGIYPTIGI
jgi:hypothetical protein